MAVGPIGSSGSPLFDITYVTFLPNTFSGPEPPMGATCESPPASTSPASPISASPKSRRRWELQRRPLDHTGGLLLWVFAESSG